MSLLLDIALVAAVGVFVAGAAIAPALLLWLLIQAAEAWTCKQPRGKP